MGVLELIGLLFILYHLICKLLWLLLDCNIALWYNDHFGTPISTMRDHVVWITGASSGIGRSLALNLARRGVRLVLSARRKSLLEELHAECLREARGFLTDKDILVLPMDMLELDTHQKCFQAVLDNFGTIDILVNNAGRSQRANWEDISVQVDRELFELDVFSVMHLSRIVVRYFLEHRNGHGHIAATSSVAGFCVVPYSATYCAAKHSLNAYMNALRMEHRHIDVTLFSPGPIQTDFLQEAFTAEPNVKCGESTKNQKRMSAERCGHLFAVAIANKMDFTWCGLFPVNFLASASRSPTLAKLIFYAMGDKTLNKIREGKI